MATPNTREHSGISNDEELVHARAIQRFAREKDSATGRYRAAVKAAKSAGCNVEKLLAAIAAKRQEPDEVVMGLRDFVHYSQLLGIPGIAPDAIFARDIRISDKTQSEEDAFEAEQRGYKAGRHGEKATENPFQAGTELHVVWHEWWLKGQEAIAMEMEPKPAAADRQHPGRKGKGKGNAAAGAEAGSQTPPPGRKKGANGNGNGGTRKRGARAGTEAPTTPLH